MSADADAHAAAGAGPEPGRHDAAGSAVDRTAATIYGTIVAGSVLAAGAGHSTVGQTTLAVVVTVLVYWLAEAYAHVLATRLVGETPDRLAHLRARLSSTWRLVTASYAPLAALLIAAALGADDRDAVTVALVATTLLLAALGWVAARRTGRHGLWLVASALASSLIGLVLIALKFALH